MKDIFHTVKKTAFFKTLSSALVAVDFSDMLSGPGPFTLFAPVDKAFDRLPAENRQKLLQNKWELAQLLAYHVMPDRVTIVDIENMGLAKMMNEKIFDIVVTNDKVKIDGAKIIQSDILCSNGVIHAIDSIINIG
jgi:uncharacterized surface protein with fasciclin (FAS1) repeats